uniref:Uncharacterized protein n=1 Tax=Thermodesulfobacterium geofontis TaxID=1295609 RepID=A0A7C4JQ24_9BACT
MISKKVFQRFSIKNVKGYQPDFRLILTFLLGIFIGVFLTLLFIFTIGKDLIQPKYYTASLTQRMKKYGSYGYYLWSWNVVKDGNIICSNPYVWIITKEIECE